MQTHRRPKVYEGQSSLMYNMAFPKLHRLRRTSETTADSYFWTCIQLLTSSGSNKKFCRQGVWITKLGYVDSLFETFTRRDLLNEDIVKVARSWNRKYLHMNPEKFVTCPQQKKWHVEWKPDAVPKHGILFLKQHSATGQILSYLYRIK